jgi:hypothetical protein
MPVRVERRSGEKPYKIVEIETGKVVGESETRRDAETSARIRNIAERDKK